MLVCSVVHYRILWNTIVYTVHTSLKSGYWLHPADTMYTCTHTHARTHAHTTTCHTCTDTHYTHTDTHIHTDTQIQLP